jgi:N-acetyl-alpha-D-glucosaminyl L-malate synthase BshA
MTVHHDPEAASRRRGHSLRLAVICHSTLGGSAHSAVRLAASLARQGHSVHLLSPASLPWLPGAGVTHHRLDPDSGHLDDPSLTPWSPALFERFEALLHRVVETHRIEVAHFHYAIPFASMGARLASSPLGRQCAVAVTLHGTDVTGGASGIERQRLGASLMRAAAVTTVSRASARQARYLLRLPVEPQVIHNFVTAGEHRPADLSREQHRVRLRRPHLIHVSNFRAVKSTGSLDHLFALVRERINAELWLVGEGPELPALRMALERSAPHDAVRYLGMRGDVPSLLPQADLVVLTSLEESFGLVALEGMASGVPVLAPKVGGIPEVVEDGVSGVLFRAGDTLHAAERAVDLLSNQDRHWALREGAIGRARAFSEARIVAEYEELYQRLSHPDAAPARRLAASFQAG